jgi:hypothetical protein
VIAKLPPFVRILSFNMCDDPHEVGTLVAHVTCAVEQTFVRVLVSRDSPRRILVALVVSGVETDLSGELRQAVALRVERLVRWMLREETRRG